MDRIYPVLLIFAVTLYIFSVLMAIESSATDRNYTEIRKQFLEDEIKLFNRRNLVLSDQEKSVNDIIQRAKTKELSTGYADDKNFLPLQHFFNARNQIINNSTLFGIIKKIPKGCSLHTHMLAGVSVDFILKNLTYLPNLYFGYVNNFFKLRFMVDPIPDDNVTWTNLSEARKVNDTFDVWLRSQLSLEVEKPLDVYPTAKEVWKKFKTIFTACYDLVAYRPVFKQYVYQLLQELHDDNVFYTELRGTFMTLYELNRTQYDVKRFFEIFSNVVEKFKEDHPNFLGVRYIHSVYKGVTFEVLETNLQQLIEMKKLFPNFIAGFDFVGYEEEGYTLFHYYPVLQKYQGELNFVFHSGETNWFGHTDLNLYDGISLSTLRIGHGFALSKHPLMMQLIKKRNLAVEICPISNQVLMLNADHRNHAAAVFLANGIPIVIGNDDPGIWGATGLSFDWYTVFLAMTPQQIGIEILKQFAFDSIDYSFMTEQEKDLAVIEWKLRWDIFLKELL